MLTSDRVPTDSRESTDSNFSPPASAQYTSYLKRRAARRRRITLARVAILLGFLAFWHVGVSVGLWDPLLTSSPTAVTATAWQLAEQGTLFTNTWTTLQETLVSAALGYLIGLAVAVLLWWFPFLARVLDPYLVILNAMPKVALAPLFFIFLGQTLSIYGVAISISVIVTILMIYTSFSAVDDNRIKLLRTFGASRSQMLTKIVLPGSTADLVAAGKVAVGLTLVGVVVGEFVAAKSGLGYQILYGSQIFNMSMVMVAVVVLMIISAVLYFAVSLLESLLVRRK